MRILHTRKSTNNGKFHDMPEKDAGGGRETGNLLEWPNGPSEKRTTSLQRTSAVLLIEFTIVIVH